jgi:autophagy-related protein 101
MGFNDVDCDFVDYTYVSLENIKKISHQEITTTKKYFFIKVQLNSNDLFSKLKREIDLFKESLKLDESNKISLEFFTKKKRSWPLGFQSENIPWEIWTVKIELMQLSNENGKFYWIIERNK